MTNDRFRDQLTVDFANMDVESKKELEVLLRVKGYHRKTHGKNTYKFHPTQDQLDGAWDYLKAGYTYEEYRKTKPRVVPEKQDQVSIKAKGFKKRMIRDRKTGRIIGWE